MPSDGTGDHTGGCLELINLILNADCGAIWREQTKR